MEYSFKGTTLEWLSPVSTVDNKFLAMLFAAAWSLPCSVFFLFKCTNQEQLHNNNIALIF
jgi:hypothetical protein